MLSREVLKDWAVKWQTTEQNVLREYCQHLILASLYRLPLSEKMAFKGGTALRIAFGSPRFSEDLDFTAGISVYRLRLLLKEMLHEVTQTGLEISTEEETPTSGGYLSLYQCQAYDRKIAVSCNISTRKRASCEAFLISTPLTSPYQALLLKTEDLVSEKIQALLARKKSRDFFDLYFLLRERRGLKAILPFLDRLRKEVEVLDARQVQRELKFFLPASYQRIAASLPQALRQELQRI